jgi:proteasome lid subunit RPN8/RPN11
MTDAIRSGLAQDSIFRPLGLVEEPIQRQARSTARSGYVVYSGRSGFEVAIPDVVVERMIALGKRTAPLEWYGLLVGRVCEDGRGRHVVILGIVPDPDADAGHGSVQTSFDSELRTRASARLLYPDGILVGWVHGHVRYGARYSSTDFKNQATWSQAHAVGIVVDPFSKPELGVYRGPEGEVLDLVLEPPLVVPGPSMMTARSDAAPRPSRRLSKIAAATVRAGRRLQPVATFIALAMALAGVALTLQRAAIIDEQVARVSRRVADLIDICRREPAPAQPAPTPICGEAVQSTKPDICVWPACFAP